jgi:hypothetical protein
MGGLEEWLPLVRTNARVQKPAYRAAVRYANAPGAVARGTGRTARLARAAQELVRERLTSNLWYI